MKNTKKRDTVRDCESTTAPSKYVICGKQTLIPCKSYVMMWTAKGTHNIGKYTHIMYRKYKK